MSEDDEPDDEMDERVTSPMQAFGSREITVGLVVFVIGLLVTFILPFVF